MSLGLMSLALTNPELAFRFFLQLMMILAACRAVGWLAGKIGQPPVIGEMVAGVLLGPSLAAALPDVSLFGAGLSEWQQRLFPPKSVSMSIIYVIAQLGLVLYMFLVGVEFQTDTLRRHARSAAAVSIVGMLVPFGLGALLALGFCGDRGLFTENVSKPQAMLYLGTAMAITAFPMLARIIEERGVSGTRLGTLALAAGSLGDAAAWCVLAVVLAGFQAGAAGWAIGGGATYVLFVLFFLRPLLRPLGRRVADAGGLSAPLLTLVLLLLLPAACYADWVGIHAVFGAFILGTAMPRGLFSEELRRKLGPLTTALLVPLFFVYSGLNTRIDFVNTWALWGLTGLVLAAACVGKGVACWAAARWSGESPREAAALGALMNARGMMELIILNIGLERGLITPTLFSIMVIMALATTLMATPLFEWAYRPHKSAARGTGPVGGSA